MILIFMPESSYPCYPVSGAAGSSDTEGKAAKRGGSRVSFKSVVSDTLFVSIRVHSWLMISHGEESGLD